MSDNTPGSGAPTPASPEPSRLVAVWDLPLRLSHWLLAGSVLIAWFSANVYDTLHEISGYLALGVLIFRLAWGFAGGPNSRFRNYLHSPRATLRYLAGLGRGQSSRSLGLNPAGAAMALTLLASIVVATVSGWMQLTVTFFGVAWVENLHRWTSNLVIVLVVVHVLGVLVMCVLLRENLVRAMITGRKRAETN